MNHFTLRSIAFYGGAIASVIALFSVVTSYGETYLKAAETIGGDYVVKLPPSVACAQNQPLKLSLQQSGIYVAAALSKADAKPNASKPMTLNGQWKNQTLTLMGTAPQNVLCATGKIALTAQKVDKADALTGTFRLDVGDVPFAAQRQLMPKPNEPSK